MPLWRSTAHNPVRMLQLLTPTTRWRARWRAPSGSPTYDAAVAGLDATRAAHNTWCASRAPAISTASQIAYFSAEFALHQSLPIYAGGLGVLAGDHCKEASDLGVPLVGVGFMYPQGYFHQAMSPDGWQQERYERLNWARRADRAGAHARRQAVRHGGAARRSDGAGRGLARARWDA